MKEIVMYSRSYGCPYVKSAKRILDKHQLAYRQILIDRDSAAKARVVEWTGFESVPTIVAANHGSDLPFEPPTPLPAGASPKDVNRGSMITEPSNQSLTNWLYQNDFIEK
ncbi:MAG: glutaredoxin family protein [Anaerolineales bacterium]|nr:glutaredoxin family protein [Anaerolineales bacterium]